MDASSISVMMFSMDVSSPSRPLLGAYRTDPAPPPQTESRGIGIHGMGTVIIERETFRQLQLDFYREEFADVRADERVLDIGCGTGLLSRSLGPVRSPLEHMAIDLSPGMIAVARERAIPEGNTQYVVMDAHDLVFHDGMFDVAMLGQSLACLEDPWRAFAEIRRVLRPNGRIAVSCRCRSLSTPAQGVFFERLERLAIVRPRTPPHHAVGAHRDARDGWVHRHSRHATPCRRARP